MRLNDDFQLMFLVNLRKRGAVSEEELRIGLARRLAELVKELPPARRRRLRRAHRRTPALPGLTPQITWEVL